MKALNIHKRRHRLKLVTERIEASPAISDDDRRLILEFRDHGFAEGLCVERVEHYLRIMNKIVEWTKPRGISLRGARKEDLIEPVGWVERRPLSDWTKHDYRVALKKFYKWLNGGKSYPPEVKWIRLLSKRSSRLLIDDSEPRNLCMNKCIAFLRAHSTVASMKRSPPVTEYLRSLRLRTSRRAQVGEVKRYSLDTVWPENASSQLVKKLFSS